MKVWSMAAVAALALVGPVAAQTSSGVTISLQLKDTEAVGSDTQDLIHKLLGPNVTPESVPTKDGGGRVVRFKSVIWSSLLTDKEREADRSALMARWGSALRIEDNTPGSGALPRAISAHEKPKMPSIDAALGAVPSSLRDGEGRGYDGSSVRSGAAPVPRAVPNAAATPAPGRPAPSLAPVSAKPAPSLIAKPIFVPSPVAAAVAEAPAPLGPYNAMIDKTAREAGIDPALLRAVVVAKSGYQADRAVAGAYGLMGVSANNAKAYGYTTKQVLDPETNLRVGADILSDLLREFDGDTSRALAAYQAGPHAVLRSGGIPNRRDVRDFMNSVQLALGPKARKDSLPVKPKHSLFKDTAAEDAIELAEQQRHVRNGDGVEPYRPLIEKAVAAVGGVDNPRLMEAILMQEDASGDPNAVGTFGEQGLAQLMPATAAWMGVKNAFDPYQNLVGQAKYFRHLLRVFDGNEVLAVSAYNAGEGTIENAGDKVTNKTYVRRVFNNYYALTGQRVDVNPYIQPGR